MLGERGYVLETLHAGGVAGPQQAGLVRVYDVTDAGEPRDLTDPATGTVPRTLIAFPPRLHTIRYAGVLGPANPWRSRLAPQPAQGPAAASDEPGRPSHAGGYRPWAELLARTFAVDVLACPRCQGRMKLLGLVKNPAIISRTLATVGEATEVPPRSPGRGPPYWRSRVLRRQVLGDEEDGAGRGSRADEVASGA